MSRAFRAPGEPLPVQPPVTVPLLAPLEPVESSSGRPLPKVGSCAAQAGRRRAIIGSFLAAGAIAAPSPAALAASPEDGPLHAMAARLKQVTRAEIQAWEAVELAKAAGVTGIELSCVLDAATAAVAAYSAVIQQIADTPANAAFGMALKAAIICRGHEGATELSEAEADVADSLKEDALRLFPEMAEMMGWI